MASRIYIVVAAILFLGSSQGLAFCLVELSKLSSNKTMIARDTVQPADVSVQRQTPPRSIAEKTKFEVSERTRVPSFEPSSRRTTTQRPEISTRLETVATRRRRNVVLPKVENSLPKIESVAVPKPPEMKPNGDVTVTLRTPSEISGVAVRAPQVRPPSPSNLQRKRRMAQPDIPTQTASLGRTGSRLSPRITPTVPESDLKVEPIATRIPTKVEDTDSSNPRLGVSGSKKRFRTADVKPRIRSTSKSADAPPKLEDFVSTQPRGRVKPFVDAVARQKNALDEVARSTSGVIANAIKGLARKKNSPRAETRKPSNQTTVRSPAKNDSPRVKPIPFESRVAQTKPQSTTTIKVEVGRRPNDVSGEQKETKVDRRKLAASRLSSFLLGLGAFFGSGEASGDEEHGPGGSTGPSHSAPKSIAKFSNPRTRQSVVTRGQKGTNRVPTKALNSRVASSQRRAQTSIPKPISVPKLPAMKPMQTVQVSRTPVVQSGAATQKPTFLRQKPQLSAPAKLSLAGYDPTAGTSSSSGNEDGGTPVAAGSGSAQKGFGGSFFDSVGTPVEPGKAPRRPYQVSRKPATKLALLKKQPKKQFGRPGNTFTGFKPVKTSAAGSANDSETVFSPEAEAFLKRFKRLAKVEELVKLGNVLFDGNTMRVPFHVNGFGGTLVVRMQRSQMKVSLESFHSGSRDQLVKEMRETFKHMKSNGTQLPRGLFRLAAADRILRFPTSAGIQVLKGFLKFIEQTRLDRQSDHQVLFGSL